ncbi:Hypothetical predicted protein [Lecanosticta acicola]|uniref:Uncharacterized protein n=1 Tax=Lecanosticta acicola TaxID=111012 RepID=A0AAI9ED81_9PEZI|nr:Hypothetical predicted protein [Lecanosticta acicola]
MIETLGIRPGISYPGQSEGQTQQQPRQPRRVPPPLPARSSSGEPQFSTSPPNRWEKPGFKPPPPYSELPPTPPYSEHHDSHLAAPPSLSPQPPAGDPRYHSLSPSQSEDALSNTSSPAANDDEILQQALQFTRHPVSDYAKTARRLEKPIAIPQVSKGVGMPFGRAYSDALSDYGISTQEFVELIESQHLRLHRTPQSPRRSWQRNRRGPRTQLPTHRSRNSRLRQTRQGRNVHNPSKALLKNINDEFFLPRGLRVQLVKGKELKAHLGLPPETTFAAPFHPNVQVSIHERRVAGVSEYTMPLRWDVPDPTEATNTLDRMNASAQKRQLAKEALKAEENQAKHSKKLQKRPKNTDKQDSTRDKQLEKLEEDISKETRKRDQAKAKILHEKQGNDEAEKVAKEMAKLD